MCTYQNVKRNAIFRMVSGRIFQHLNKNISLLFFFHGSDNFKLLIPFIVKLSQRMRLTHPYFTLMMMMMIPVFMASPLYPLHLLCLIQIKEIITIGTSFHKSEFKILHCLFWWRHVKLPFNAGNDDFSTKVI